MGKLGWSPYDYYTSSLCEFYYACKGYFDKEEAQYDLMRHVALFSSHLGSAAFNKAWPKRLTDADGNSIMKEVSVVEFKEWADNMRDKYKRLNARNKSNSRSQPATGSKGT